jgi:hypothetical protein
MNTPNRSQFNQGKIIMLPKEHEAPTATEPTSRDYKANWDQLREELRSKIEHKKSAIETMQRDIDQLNAILCAMLRCGHE